MKIVSSTSSFNFLWAFAIIALGLVLEGCSVSTVKTTGSPVGTTVAKSGLHYFLPKGRIHLVGDYKKGKDGQATEVFEVILSRVNEPDRCGRFVLQQNFSAIHDEDTSFTVNEKGLLNSSLAVNPAGQIGEIITTAGKTFLAVADAAVRTEGLDGTQGVGVLGDAATKVATASFFPFEVSFDPFNEAEVENAQSVLKKCGFLLGLGAAGKNYKFPNESGYEIENILDDAKCAMIPKAPKIGVYYRPLTTVRITLVAGNYNKTKPTQDGKNQVGISKTEDVAIPDPHGLAYYPFIRPLLVKKETTIGFLDGEPRSFTHKYPSEALALVRIPKDLAEDLVTRVTNITTFVKTNGTLQSASTKDELDRLKTQNGILDEKLDQIEKQKKLQDAQNVHPSNVPSP